MKNSTLALCASIMTMLAGMALSMVDVIDMSVYMLGISILCRAIEGNKNGN